MIPSDGAQPGDAKATGRESVEADAADSHEDHVIPLQHGEHPPLPGAVKIASTDYAQVHHSTRTKARKQALDVLFQADLRGESVVDSLARRADQDENPLREFANDIIAGYADHAREIDAHISRRLTGEWTLERMSRVDRTIARIAVWELDRTTVDMRIVISEALELANELSGDESVNFLNGLLAAVASDRPEPDALA